MLDCMIEGAETRLCWIKVDRGPQAMQRGGIRCPEDRAEKEDGRLDPQVMISGCC